MRRTVRKQIEGCAAVKKSKHVKKNGRRNNKLLRSQSFFFTSKNCYLTFYLLKHHTVNWIILRFPFLSITFNLSFEQKDGPVYAPNGPTLEFKVVRDRTNFIDLQNIYLEVNCRILRLNGYKLEYDASNAVETDSPFFVNFTLLFFLCV